MCLIPLKAFSLLSDVYNNFKHIEELMTVRRTNEHYSLFICRIMCSLLLDAGHAIMS